MPYGIHNTVVNSDTVFSVFDRVNGVIANRETAYVV